jgi:predicted transcriptional regulator
VLRQDAVADNSRAAASIRIDDELRAGSRVDKLALICGQNQPTITVATTVKKSIDRAKEKSYLQYSND